MSNANGVTLSAVGPCHSNPTETVAKESVNPMSQVLTFVGNETHPLRDSLTRALSRPQFALSLEEEKTRSDELGSPFVMCLIDVDSLRNINDQLGRRIGDNVLAEVAARIRSRMDEPDLDEIEFLHARFDGDAFMLLARDTSTRQGRLLAEKIRDAVREEAVCERVTVTVTIGLAQYRIGEATDQTLNRCERALALAKQCGTDHIEVAPAPENHRESNVVHLPNLNLTARRRRLIV